ncbi:MAG: ascorbate system component [Eubacteriaceae bacterium]|jgi:PTS system ascorbate-specific IIB component|nr:ascorbate system component [Eubacteriaceae bacterium]MDK2904590.1 ascorbate system component [Eubacteriaceae bacterium]MDK2937111.1 ascorbate system component [Eubacteriaceae bacterium]MDK2961330.1 ascorbate system component [Eubacteriaceae bacterium]MDN5307480.1 ascorbate system component [Eubacteriaceae bacterium]
MFKVLTVCAVGVGSSLMLKMNAGTILKNHGYKASIENTNMSGASGCRVDILITTEDVYKQIKNVNTKEVVILKNMVSKKELEEKLIPVCQKLEG